MIIRRQRGRWQEDIPQTPWRWLFVPLWLIYALMTVVRGWAYDRGWLTTRKIGVPVISIGNLVAGGAGKTPVAIAMAQWARELGLKPAIIARGYRARANGRNEEAELAGDIAVHCHPDRVFAATAASAAGADVLIMDDGFQHRRLHRDLDVVVIDATRPWGDERGAQGWMLPLGYRREPLMAIARAQLVWISRWDAVDAQRQTQITALLTARLNAQAIVVHEHLHGIDLDPVPAHHKAAWLLVSGIGNPAGFELMATSAGAEVAESWRYPDHHHYSAADAAAITAAASGAGAVVVTTSKDAVKLRPLLPAITVLTVRSGLTEQAQRTVIALLRTCCGLAK